MTMITEITEAQRSLVVKMAHARMNQMAATTRNAWMDKEYIELENLVAQMHDAV